MSKNRRGFTLMEIIVVLVILAILAVVAIPTMMGYIEKSREAEVLQDITTIRSAFDTSLVWAADEDLLMDANHKKGQYFIHGLEGNKDEFDQALEKHMDELLRDDLAAKSYSLHALTANAEKLNEFDLYITLTYDKNGKTVTYTWDNKTGDLKKT